jgi:hypothetical protein
MSGLNQNLTNNEYLVERIKTGVTHPYLGAIPTTGCIPLPETLTGTISTDNSGGATAGNGKIVLGVGTIFLTEVMPGDFLYNGTSVRKVRYVFSDTMLEIENAFPSSLTTQALKVPKRNLYKRIQVSCAGTGNSIVQEAHIKIGDIVVTGGTPLAYDAAAANAELEFTCSK